MTPGRDTLGDSIRALHAAFLPTITDPHLARLWDRDLNAATLGIVHGLIAVGGRAFVLDHEADDDDATPFLIATASDDGESFRIVPASTEQVWGLPLADRFDWRGEPME
jgi:hypothetical protein